ncbi:uncharacterized protein RAG0_05751 [Rhynchosporium agropyri]|uniref:Uncharacterized protein n=1 Tax=Rhynchosporium agropyri TaxID=914238 RepID=A0A1E1KEC6_9HELO|nr:uncharacterized protein RAG0_05751 [Rhynchosporium agropyri]
MSARRISISLTYIALLSLATRYYNKRKGIVPKAISEYILTLKVYDINNFSTLNKRAPDNSVDASLLKRYKSIYSCGNYYSSESTTSLPVGTTSLLIVKEEKEDKEDLSVIKPSNNTKGS